MPGQLSNQDVQKLVHQAYGKYSTHKHSSSLLQKWAIKILDMPGFDHIMAVIIVANLVVMIIDTDRTAREEDSTDWTAYFSWGVLVVFIIELLVRCFALQSAFWKEPSNVCDFVIIAVDGIFSTLGLVGHELFPVSVLRIFRLARLARVSKIVQFFPELKMLLAGLMGSIKAIFWGTLMLLLFLLVSGMVAVLLIHPLNKDIEYDDCERCHRAYSSVANATLTLWQQVVAGDAWGEVTIPIIERHPITALFFVPIFLAVGLAMMNLFLGVVVNVAQEAYDEQQRFDDAILALQKLQQRTNILELCKRMDKDGDGRLSYDEIHAGFVQPGEFRERILSMGIGEENFGMAWKLLDSNESGSVDYKEFVTFLCTINTKNTQFFLEYITHQIDVVKHTLLERLGTYQAVIANMDSKLQEPIQQEEQNFTNFAKGQSVPVRPCTTSTSERDSTESLKQYISDGLEKLSMELKDIFMERKFATMESTFSTMQHVEVSTFSTRGQDGVDLYAQPDLLVVHDIPKSFGNRSLCCSRVPDVAPRNSRVQPDLLVAPDARKSFGILSGCCSRLPDVGPQNSPQSGVNSMLQHGRLSVPEGMVVA